jgi:signal transduction histidine kinase
MSRDTLEVILIAASWSVAVGIVCALLTLALQRSSVRWSAGLVALAAVGGIVAGVVGTSRAMFLSQHDFTVVMIICTVSGIVSLAFALWLARRLVTSTNALRRAAQQMRGAEGVKAEPGGPREFRAIADELSRSDRMLREAAERERRLDQSRRELVAWVSHDLRTPLAGLRAMTEALEDDMVDDPERYHARMRTEVDRMVRMVDDLFELSRIHAGNLQLSVQTVHLGDVVSETIAGTVPVAQAKGVHLDGAISPDVLVRADPTALSRVVGNLVMNAIRHTPADGSVHIVGRHDGDAVELAVTDACGGISDPDLERVFDVAWRGSHARTPGSDAGAGLGLAIVKGLVEAHHGTVHVANQAPGCRFVVRLPA